MKLFSALDYLGINTANAYGLDKESYELRLFWFYNTVAEQDMSEWTHIEFLAYLEELGGFDTFDEPNSLLGALRAYQAYQNQEESGYKISLDAICSGIQIMGAIMKEPNALDSTGALTNRRADAYMDVYDEFKKLYGKPTTKTRKQCKQAIMPYMYGSNKSAETYFGSSEEELKAFKQALNNKFPEVCKLRDLWCEAFKMDVRHNIFQLPDGFTAVLPNIVQEKYNLPFMEESIEVKLTNVNFPSRKRVSNSANLTHAIDGFIVREMHRRAKFNPKDIYMFMCDLRKYSHIHEPLTNESKCSEKVRELIGLYNSTRIPTIRIADFIKSDEVKYLPKELKAKLYEISGFMLQQGEFDLVTVHDCFQCLPSKGNYVRHWYNQILGDLTESTIVEHLTREISPVDIPFKPVTEKEIAIWKKLADKVRESNYAIC